MGRIYTGMYMYIISRVCNEMVCTGVLYVSHPLSVVPEEFDYNSQTGKHGDRSQRLEIRRSSVEYIAPSEYMVSE